MFGIKKRKSQSKMRIWKKAVLHNGLAKRRLGSFLNERPVSRAVDDAFISLFRMVDMGGYGNKLGTGGHLTESFISMGYGVSSCNCY